MLNNGSWLIVLLLFSSCAIKPYQKMHLNDPDMALQDDKSTKFESGFQTYREGPAGATGGKSGGGCGCN